MCPRPGPETLRDVFTELMMTEPMQQWARQYAEEILEREAAEVAAFPLAREDTLALRAELGSR